MDDASLSEVVVFWFEDLDHKYWFVRDASIDSVITTRFGAIHAQLARMPVAVFDTPTKTLAAIIVLDQFPRNMFRENAKAFATDGLALDLSKAGIAAGQDAALSSVQKSFFYMPFMHSERVEDQVRSLELFGAPGLENNHSFAVAHKAIIDRFGRYPHRNAVLGRKSTEAELQFLQEPDSSF